MKKTYLLTIFKESVSDGNTTKIIGSFSSKAIAENVRIDKREACTTELERLVSDVKVNHYADLDDRKDHIYVSSSKMGISYALTITEMTIDEVTDIILTD